MRKNDGNVKSTQGVWRKKEHRHEKVADEPIIEATLGSPSVRNLNAGNNFAALANDTTLVAISDIVQATTIRECVIGIEPQQDSLRFLQDKHHQMYEALVNTSEDECSNTIDGEVSREKENEFFNDHIILATNQVEGTHPQDFVEHAQRSPREIDDPTLAMMKKVSALARKKVKHLDGYIKEIWDERMGQTFACIHCGTFFREFDKAQKHVSKDHPALAKQFSKGKVWSIFNGKGCIHRDVKAGNILVDSHGAIKLGDLGVSASLFDSGDRRHKRNTITGTPCWMAPEILDMEEGHGYDFKADIWSFGITAIELAHGHAPFSEYPPMKLFLTILTDDPPRLDDTKDQKFSKQFKQMIAKCLVKDPSKRPSATTLLRHRFFKNHKSSCVRALLVKIPSTVGKGPKTVKVNVEHMQAPSNIQDVQKEEISHNQYVRGVSNWNFDIEELKAQAALIEDEEESFSAEASSENGDEGDKDNNG
ncbi:hypothetical protein IFM89_000657 [Coptis chinensis]|uniref:Protein kinase domain-containing protein n=1 Tax=Coptis chinensis TaxID=261450 RepID=A0A835M3E3_9MAGN|nr:hypothetical protein IFM89_000657 [Coptis chinensis]